MITYENPVFERTSDKDLSRITEEFLEIIDDIAKNYDEMVRENQKREADSIRYTSSFFTNV